MRILLPFLELSAPVAGQKVWVQVSKTGDFFSKRYKKFSITELMLSQMVDNFDANQPVPADYDHISTTPVDRRPPDPTAGRAAGWIYGLEKRAKQLWALVDWTEEAAEHIKKKHYRYISPVIDQEYVPVEGETKSVGAKLLGMAITNHPFLLGMSPLALSGDVLALAELSLSERQQRIASAFYDKYGTSFDLGAYIVSYYDDYVVACREGKYWKIPFTAAENYDSVTFGEAVEVIGSWTELSAQGERTMPPTAEELAAQAPAAAQGQNTVVQLTALQSTVLQLQSDLTAERTRNDKLEQTIKKNDAATKVGTLIRAGKLLPAQKDWAEAYCLSNPEQFDIFAATLTKVVNLNTEHGGGDSDVVAGELGVETSSADISAFENAVESYAKEHKVTYSEAMAAVQKEKPALALSYLTAQREETTVG